MKKKMVIICGLSITLYALWIFNFNCLKNATVGSNQISVINVIKKKVNKEISCYFDPSNIYSIEAFNENEITDDNNIFFIETSCSGDAGLELDARQFCSIESAAKMNPKMKIHLLILSSSEYSPKTKKLFSHLKDYKNIFVRRIFIEDYVKNTPLADWWQKGELTTSRWPKHHMSDVLRYLTLWKVPGIYMDLDVVTLSSFEKMRDFVGAEDSDTLASCVISFGGSKIGREVADGCINDLKNNFRGDVWRNNGPDVITRVLTKVCGKAITNETDGCNGFTIFSQWEFTPIYYDNWKKYFEAENKDETLKLIRKSSAIHIWNKMSHSGRVKVGSQVPYGIIASQFCPKIYNNCGLWF